MNDDEREQPWPLPDLQLSKNKSFSISSQRLPSAILSHTSNLLSNLPLLNSHTLTSLSPLTPPSTMPAHILLLGAHGKVALQLLPLLLARSWSVTALIRDAAQTPDILNTRLSIPASSTTPGKLDVLVENLEDVKSPADASRILGRVKGCNWVIWAAGELPSLLCALRGAALEPAPHITHATAFRESEG